jgi:DNA-binding MarR family transcriptional regulator
MRAVANSRPAFFCTNEHAMKREQTPEITGLDQEVLRQFRTIFKSVRRHFQDIEQSIGISGSQLWAAAVIAQTPGTSVSRLASAMSIHQSTASNLVDKLTGMGLITRQRAQHDSRVVELFITESGSEKLAQAPAPIIGLLPDALGKLPYTTLVDLHKNLTGLLAQMSSPTPHDGNTPLADL